MAAPAASTKAVESLVTEKNRFFAALADHKENRQPKPDAKKSNGQDIQFVFDRVNKKNTSKSIKKNYRFLAQQQEAGLALEYKNLMSVIKKHEEEYAFILKGQAQIEQEQQKIDLILEKDATDVAALARQQELPVREQELEEALERNKDAREKLSQSYLLCLNHACLMTMHARGYGYNPNKEVKSYLDDIHFLCLSYKQIVPAEEIKTMSQKLLEDLSDFASTPEHLSKIKSWVGFANAHRLLLVFSRISWQQSITLARQLDWFNQLEDMGLYFNLERINYPNHLFNILSVGLFAIRFLMNAAMVIKHTFFPSKAEQGLTADQRFWQELEKRHWVMVNDLIWAIINGLSNFAPYLNIAAPTANWLLAGFLVFDVLWMGWRYYVEEQAYFAKKKQYDAEIIELEEEIQQYLDEINQNDLEPDKGQALRAQMQQLENQIYTLNEQLEQLEIHRYGTNWETLFNVAAALLLMVGFSASLIFMTPILIPICFLLCNMAIAMYLSADKFGAYMKADLVYKKDVEHERLCASTQATQEAWDIFVMSMVKNTVMPVIIMGLFAVCWPAALTLTLVYIAYECGNGYLNYPLLPPKKDPAPEETTSEEEEEEEEETTSELSFA